MDALTARTGRVGAGDYVAYDHGAHVATWRVDGVPVVWTSRCTRLEPGRPIRGGVPLCWPWFADGPDGDVSPSHGFVRTAPWRLTGHEQSATRHVLAWELTERDVVGVDGASRYPHPFALECRATVAEALTVELTVRNTGAAPAEHEVALHTYLHVGDVRQVRITGLEGVEVYDKVTRTTRTQEGTLGVSGEIDRIHSSTGMVRVHDPVLQRVVTIAKRSSRDTVVWNPGPDLVRELPDLGDEEWTEMLCVETADVGRHAVTLEPGGSRTVATRISVEPMRLDARTGDRASLD